MELVPGASARLLAYLERLEAQRDPARSDMDRLVDALAERGLEPEAWEGLVALDGALGGLSLAGGRLRLGPAWPLLAPSEWSGRGVKGDAWPALEREGHVLWLAGATPAAHADYVAGPDGSLSLLDRDDGELSLLASSGLLLLEKNALLSEATRALAEAATLVLGASLSEAWLEGQGLALVAEASDAVSAFYADDRALVRISMVDDAPETTAIATAPELLVALAQEAPDAALALDGEGPRYDATAAALEAAGRLP